MRPFGGPWHKIVLYLQRKKLYGVCQELFGEQAILYRFSPVFTVIVKTIGYGDLPVNPRQ